MEKYVVKELNGNMYHNNELFQDLGNKYVNHSWYANEYPLQDGMIMYVHTKGDDQYWWRCKVGGMAFKNRIFKYIQRINGAPTRYKLTHFNSYFPEKMIMGEKFRRIMQWS